jgi:hypothetical protein
MKINVMLKDPDGVYDSIEQAVEASLPDGLSAREKAALAEARREETSEALRKWIEHGEYVSIEFDTEAMTATVVAK